MPRLFRQPREAAPVLLLGVLSGYPVGAAAARRLYEEDAAAQSRQSALWRCATIQAPPSLSVSSGRRCGIPPRWGGCFTAAILRRRCFSGMLLSIGSPCPETPVQGARLRQSLFFPAFVSAVKNSAMTCLFIAAFVIFFGVVISLLPTGNGTAGVLLSGLLEMTNGVTKVSTLAQAPYLRLALQSFLIGTAGLSIFCQVASVLEGSGLSLTPYCYGKLLQGAIALLLTLLLSPFFPQDISVMLPITPELTLSSFAILTALTVGSFLVSVGVVMVFSMVTDAAMRKKIRHKKETICEHARMELLFAVSCCINLRNMRRWLQTFMRLCRHHSPKQTAFPLAEKRRNRSFHMLRWTRKGLIESFGGCPSAGSVVESCIQNCGQPQHKSCSTGKSMPQPGPLLRQIVFSPCGGCEGEF